MRRAKVMTLVGLASVSATADGLPVAAQLFQARPAALLAPYPSARHHQGYLQRHQRQLPDPTQTGFMHLPAAAAALLAMHSAGRGHKVDGDCPAAVAGPDDALYPVAFPAAQRGNHLPIQHDLTLEP